MEIYKKYIEVNEHSLQYSIYLSKNSTYGIYLFGNFYQPTQPALFFLSVLRGGGGGKGSAELVITQVKK